MRLHFFALLSLVACGGGGKPNLVDAAPPDEAVFTCGLSGSISGSANLTPPGGPTLTAAKTMAGNLAFGIVLEPSMPGTTTQGLFLIMIDNLGMFQAAGAVGRFTAPKVATATMNVGSIAPAGNSPPEVACGGCIEGYSGFMESNGQVMLNTAQQGFFNVDKTGTANITKWTPAATPNGTSTIDVTYANLTLKGALLQPPPGMDTACTVTVSNLAITGLTVKWPATLLQEEPHNGDGPYGIDMALVPHIPVDFKIDAP